MSRPASRRAFMAGTAAVAATGGVSAAAAGTDPIFVLVEAERQAWEALGDTVTLQDEAATPEEEAVANAANDLAYDEWREATYRMVGTVPTTAAGLVALIERFETYTHGCMIEHEKDGLNALLLTVRNFVSGRA